MPAPASPAQRRAALLAAGGKSSRFGAIGAPQYDLKAEIDQYLAGMNRPPPLAGAIRNLPSSAWNFAKETLAKPTIEQQANMAKGYSTLIKGGYDYLAGNESPERQAAAEVVRSMWEPWSSPEKATETIVNDPVGSLAGIVTPEGKMGKVAGVAGKAGKKVAKKLGRIATGPAAAGEWHPISKLVLPRPLSEMSAGYQPTTTLLPKKPLDPQELQRQGAIIMPATSDRTMAGQQLVSINGEPLGRPVTLEGGRDFMRAQQQQAEGAGWAAARPQISGMGNRVREAGGPVILNFMPMSGSSGDYSTMMTNAVMQRLKDAKLTKKAMREFDTMMRNPTSDFPAYPEFPGIEGLIKTEGAGWIPGAGKARTKLAHEMDTRRMQDLGFPDIASIRYAITEPELLHTKPYTSGQSFAWADPGGRVIKDPQHPHGSYNTQLGAQYAGTMGADIPLDVMYPDWTRGLRTGMSESNAQYTFRTQQPMQAATQEWLDGVMRYLEAVRRGG